MSSSSILYAPRFFAGGVFITLVGLKLIYDGLQGDVPRIFEILRLRRWMMVVGGILCQTPILIYLMPVIFDISLH